MATDDGRITRLLNKWGEGDDAAFAALIELAYDDLRAIAHRRLKAVGGGETLATTALVNEAFLRLVGREGGSWASRAHFYSFASRAMRHILVDYARRTQAEKRGGDLVQVPLEDAGDASATDGYGDVLGVNAALDRLAERNPRMAHMVELRFFGGLTVPEAAEILGASVRTVEREWTRAKAYLLEEIGENDSS